MFSILIWSALIALAASTGSAAFAALAGVVALVAAARLELKRLQFEVPFYFGRPAGAFGGGLLALWAGLTSLFKGLFVGFLGLFTFSAKTSAEAPFVFGLFAICVVVGALTTFRMMAVYGSVAARWAHFRLALFLGALYSSGMYALIRNGLVDDLRIRETVTSVSGALSAGSLTPEAAIRAIDNGRRTYDALVSALVDKVIATSPAAPLGPVVQILLSSHISQGFVAAAFVVAIAETRARLGRRPGAAA